MEERRGRVKSRNMYEGPVDKDKGVGISLGVGIGQGKREQWAGVGGGKWGQL